MKKLIFLLAGTILLHTAWAQQPTEEQIEAVKDFYNTYKGYQMKHYPEEEYATEYKVAIPGQDELKEADLHSAAEAAISAEPSVTFGKGKKGNQMLRLVQTIDYSRLPNPREWQAKIVLEKVTVHMKDNPSLQLIEQDVYFEINPKVNQNGAGDFILDIPDSLDISQADSVTIDAEYYFSAPHKYEAVVFSKDDIGNTVNLKDQKITLVSMGADSVVYKVEDCREKQDPEVLLFDNEDRIFSRISSSKRIAYLHEFFEKKGYKKLRKRHLKKLALQYSNDNPDLYDYYRVITTSGSPEKMSVFFPEDKLGFWKDKQFSVTIQ